MTNYSETVIGVDPSMTATGYAHTDGSLTTSRQ
jgi:hypothetical protein